MICAKELWLWLLLMGFPGSSTGKESACSVGNWFSSWVRKIYWSRDRLPTPVFWPGEFHGLYIYIVHEVSKSQTRLSDFHFHLLLMFCHLCPCEEPMWSPLQRAIQILAFDRLCNSNGRACPLWTKSPLCIKYSDTFLRSSFGWTFTRPFHTNMHIANMLINTCQIKL